MKVDVTISDETGDFVINYGLGEYEIIDSTTNTSIVVVGGMMGGLIGTIQAIMEKVKEIE